MFRKLDQQKKIGTVSVIIGFALLFLTLVLIPLKPAGSFKYYLLSPAAALILLPIPVMWKDGLRQMKEKPPTVGHWRRMRQSGFFDLLVLLTMIALVLFLCWGFGLISYRATLSRHAALAGGTAATLEEARQIPGFVEYNFHQDLNLIAKNYSAFGVIALIIVAFVLVCGLYMRFISPIVKADEHLQIAHGVYRVCAQYAAAILIVLISLFPIYWMIISSLKTSDELMRAVPTLWPDKFVWENYPNVLNKAPFGRYLINTLVTTIIMMLGELTIGVMAAYGFSKGDFKGKNLLFMFVLGALMVPIQVTFVRGAAQPGERLLYLHAPAELFGCGQQLHRSRAHRRPGALRYHRQRPVPHVQADADHHQHHQLYQRLEQLFLAQDGHPVGGQPHHCRGRAAAEGDVRGPVRLQL